MTIDLLSISAIQSRIAELSALIAHMEKVGYGHMATTIRADRDIAVMELERRVKININQKVKV